MIKGIVQIDNKPVKYKFQIIPYSNVPELGYYILKYKINKIFYNYILIEKHVNINCLINNLERISKDEFEKDIIKHIKRLFYWR